MTVTPRNLRQIADVIRDCHDYGFGMYSSQPAAFVGDDRRRHADSRDFSDDDVWAQIEAGAGTPLPFRALQVGDERCNRTTYGFYVGGRYYPILDDDNRADLRIRDVFLRHLGGVDFAGTPLPTLGLKLLRVITRHPSVAIVFVGWTLRMTRTVGLTQLLRHRRLRPVTFVMHSFIDAAGAPTWAALQRGETSAEPRVLAAQQRLQACSHAMAHLATGDLVPACVEHSVLEPVQNIALRHAAAGIHRPGAGAALMRRHPYRAAADRSRTSPTRNRKSGSTPATPTPGRCTDV